MRLLTAVSSRLSLAMLLSLGLISCEGIPGSLEGEDAGETGGGGGSSVGGGAAGGGTSSLGGGAGISGGGAGSIGGGTGNTGGGTGSTGGGTGNTGGGTGNTGGSGGGATGVGGFSPGPTGCAAQTLDANVSVGGYMSDRYGWSDSACLRRTAALVRNTSSDPGGSRGGYLRELTLTVNGAARTARGTGANGWNGWGGREPAALGYKNTSGDDPVDEGVVVELVVHVLQKIICAEGRSRWVEFQGQCAQTGHHGHLRVGDIKRAHHERGAIG
jgi:hypothetical protein